MFPAIRAPEFVFSPAKINKIHLERRTIFHFVSKGRAKKTGAVHSNCRAAFILPIFQPVLEPVGELAGENCGGDVRIVGEINLFVVKVGSDAALVLAGFHELLEIG